MMKFSERRIMSYIK